MSLCKDSRPLFSAPSAKRSISFPEARVKQRIFLPYSFFLCFAVTLISDTSDRPAVSSPTLRGKAFNDLSKSAGRWLVLHDASSRVTRKSPGGPELPAGGWQADCLRRARCLDNRLLASFEGVEKEMCCPLHFLPTLLFFPIFLGFCSRLVRTTMLSFSELWLESKLTVFVFEMYPEYRRGYMKILK